MPDQILLNGCAPEPLIHYLKALGIFRLVAEQFDSQVRGAWRGDAFVLETAKAADELVTFLLDQYRPTPIIAPWNAGSGFHTREKESDATEPSAKKKSPGKPGKKVANFQNIKFSMSPRLATYRDVIGHAERLLTLCLTPEVLALNKQKRPDILKRMLVPLCRNELPDDCVKWFDAMCLITSDGLRFPPLAGLGGNDGNLEFSLTFMGRLHDVLATDGASRPHSAQQLHAALFGKIGARGIESSPGQFDPGGVGGVNATQGVEAKELANPWDYVLAIEGILMFAGAAVRRMAAGARGEASYPFCVQSAEIDSTIAFSEKNRGEMFLPLWECAASYPEITYLFNEGRFRLRKGRVQTGVDFARAIAELGVDRGITRFQRYGLLSRNGDAHFASNLGVIEVIERKEAGLFDEIDGWLRQYRALCSAKETPLGLLTVRKAIDTAIFRFCAHGNRDYLQAVLIALGTAQAEVARRPKLQKDTQGRSLMRPLARLSENWAHECDDHFYEFELATALASITGENKHDPFRVHLEPVEVRGGTVNWTSNDTGVVWGTGALADNLASILQRRSVEARAAGAAHPVLLGKRCASLAAVAAFLHGETDDERIEALLRGLALINWDAGLARAARLSSLMPATLPRAYALLKLLFLPDGRLRRDAWGEPLTIRHEPSVIPLLRAGRVAEALEVAERRLRSSGLIPLTNQFHIRSADSARLAAALLIPIDARATRALAAMVLRPASTE